VLEQYDDRLERGGRVALTMVFEEVAHAVIDDNRVLDELLQNAPQ
jgi:hypothetical protein